MVCAGPRGLIPSVAMIAFTVLAAAIYLTLPMVVGAVVDALGLTARQGGLIAAADMLGASISALIAAITISLGQWRTVLLIGICLVTAGNLMSGMTSHFTALFLYRVCAGLGEGVLLAIGNASIAETPNPDRMFGFSLAAQLAFGAVALYVTPWMLDGYGLRGIFWSLAILTAAATSLVRYMPDRPVADAGKIATISFSNKSAVGLAGVLTYFIAQGAVWAYLERIGSVKHIDTAAIGEALAVSSIAGLAGALLSSWLDVRWGRLKPLLIGLVLTLVSLWIMNTRIGFALFAFSASLFNFAWNLSVPFQFGALAEIDASRRTVALGGVVVFAGVSIGPALAAAMIGEAVLDGVSLIGMSFSVLSAILFVWLLWPLERTRAHAVIADRTHQ